MSVKPIQDDVQVSEVGQSPNVDKINIDSQTLPLPPMTMGEFEDLVGSIVQDSTLITSPKTISIDEPTISAPKGLETSDVAVTSSSIQNAISTVSGLESRVMDALAQLEVKKVAEGSSSNDSGLTTRDYVDQVLGGERNLEGSGLVTVGDFLGKDEGIGFIHNSEDNTFNMVQAGEIIQQDMTPREANDWIADKERANVSAVDSEVTSVTGEQVPKDPDRQTTIIKEEDIATSSDRPFSFDPEYMIVVAYLNGTDYYNLYEELRSSEYMSSPQGDAFIKCTVSNGRISGTSFVNKSDGDVIPFGTVSEMCTFEGTGDDEVQTAAYIPVVFGSGGFVGLCNHSGMFSETSFCYNGKSIVYPMRV
tara:strand:+ start:1400 stop:2488 length:1089 start_codon:yes stop_codon:yes gene_type:complete